MAKSKKQSYKSCIWFHSPDNCLWPLWKGGKPQRRKGFPKPQIATIQDMANGFSDYAKNIKKKGNEFADWQGKPEFARWYISYRQLVESWLEYARQHFPEASKLNGLPPLKDKVLLGMFALADYCKNCAAILTGETKDKAEPVYIEIDLATHIVTVGTKPYPITSDKVWMFIKTLVDDYRQHKATPRKDGLLDWKNARDMLRKKIGKIATAQMITCSRGCYTLDSGVVIKGTGQMGMHRTKSNQHKPGVN